MSPAHVDWAKLNSIVVFDVIFEWNKHPIGGQVEVVESKACLQSFPIAATGITPTETKKPTLLSQFKQVWCETKCFVVACASESTPQTIDWLLDSFNSRSQCYLNMLLSTKTN